MSLSGPKPIFDGVAIRCTGADILKYRGRYISLIFKIDAEKFDGTSNVVTGRCAISDDALTVNDFVARDNVTAVLEVYCFVDNVNGGLFYEFHSALDDEFDVKSFAMLVPHVHKNHTVFGF